MYGLECLATLPTENLAIGFRVLLVGFLGVIVCMGLLALALKVAVDVACRLTQRKGDGCPDAPKGAKVAGTPASTPSGAKPQA